MTLSYGDYSICKEWGIIKLEKAANLQLRDS